VRASDIVFYVGDILYDESLQDIGILLLRFDGEDIVDTAGGGRIDGAPVWRTWWIHAGEEYYSELGLQNLVYVGIFIQYSVLELPDLSSAIF
jgi:hypothetical protein